MNQFNLKSVNKPVGDDAPAKEGTINGTPISQIDMNRLVPNIRDEKGGMDLFSKLLSENVIRLDGQVDDTMAAIFNTALMLLEADGETEVQVIINSPGGSVTAGLSMYDAMRKTKMEVTTVVSGMAASMGSILLCAGDKRLATKNARVMIHQPSGGGRGTATSTRTNQDLIEKMWDDLTQIYVDHSGTPHEVFDKLLQSGDVWLTPEQAIKIGLVDSVVKYDKQMPKTAGMKRTKARQHFNETLDDVLDFGAEQRKAAVAKLNVSNDDDKDQDQDQDQTSKPKSAPKQG